MKELTIDQLTALVQATRPHPEGIGDGRERMTFWGDHEKALFEAASAELVNRLLAVKA